MERIQSHLSGFKEVVKFRHHCEKRFSRNNDRYPSPIWVLYLQTLNPNTFRQWVRKFSSYNLGTLLLDQTFPAKDNPHQFNSTPSEIDLLDRPVQALGWADVDLRVNLLAKEGFSKGWVELGFSQQAQDRGIDLEWHFHQFSQRSYSGSDSDTPRLIQD